VTITDEQIDAMYAADMEAYGLDDNADYELILECLEAAGWTLVKAGGISGGQIRDES
jgi:hypothetical protein